MNSFWLVESFSPTEGRTCEKMQFISALSHSQKLDLAILFPIQDPLTNMQSEFFNTSGNLGRIAPNSDPAVSPYESDSNFF